MIRETFHRQAKRLAVGCLILVLSSPAGAQYFGRQKARYRSFDFQVLKTEHFDIYFYPEEREGVDIAARLAERWYSRFEPLFDHPLSSRQPLILYASHTDFEQTNVIPEELTEGTGGVTEPLRRRIVLPLAGPLGDTDHVIGHELVHAFQFDIGKDFDGDSTGLTVGKLPLWFIEGMAEYLSLGNVDANTAMKLRDALKRHQLPSVHDLNGSDYFPYQWGHALFAYIAGRYSDAAISRLLRAATVGGDAEMAFNNVLGISAAELSLEWHAAIEQAYAPVLEASTPPIIGNRLVIRARGFGADLNIGPSLSPDGRWLAFLSSRGLFSTDLYVADATTGRVVRNLTNTAGNQHFSSIEFIRSAAAWDPASERIAMTAIVGARPTLTIFNTRTGKRDRDIVIRGVDEIVSPTWSADGHAIAFTGMRQGLTDLYVYDLGTTTLSRLTNDAYADLQPAWAPDSRHIVFATDRFSTDLGVLQVGPLQLAVIDTSGGAIEQVRALSAGKHINPQWSPDGTALYFVGDPDGVPNVYRLTIDTGRVDQLTALDTGVSGIVASSPALSVASGTGRMAMSVFNDDKYDIFVREASEPAGPLKTLLLNAAALPPLSRSTGIVTAFLSNAADGLPAEQTYPAEPYKVRLSLAGVTQPTAGAGVGQFGATATGGAALLFADILGDHVLATAFQVNSGGTGGFNVKDIAFQTAYLNMSRRWNWGAAGGQIPAGSGLASSIITPSPGQPVQQTILYRQTERHASGLMSYTFNRVRRLEFRGGSSQTSFDEISRTMISMDTGQALSTTRDTTPFAPSVNLVTAAAAIVLDNAQFGPTSPIHGRRYRFEVAPAFGTINYTGVLADYRQYVMPASFYTIAVRVMHYGRYGKEGDDARLYPLYIDNPAFIRGYDSLDYYGNNCGEVSVEDCGLSERFSGSRMLVGNLELRFPLLRPLGISRTMYGRIPAEVALFADGGAAWSGHDRPRFLGGTRPGISSAGAALRIGFGLLVFELDLTHPFQRSDAGWNFGFNLLPGW